MTDWQIYWADFEFQVRDGWPPDDPTEKPSDWWRTSNSRLVDNFREADRLWLFTSGKSCGYSNEPDVYQTFWTQVLRVAKCDDNPDYDNPYSDTCRWKYRVWALDEGCLAIFPPLLVDDIVFGFP